MLICYLSLSLPYDIYTSGQESECICIGTTTHQKEWIFSLHLRYVLALIGIYCVYVYDYSYIGWIIWFSILFRAISSLSTTAGSTFTKFGKFGLRCRHVHTYIIYPYSIIETCVHKGLFPVSASPLLCTLLCHFNCTFLLTIHAASSFFSQPTNLDDMLLSQQDMTQMTQVTPLWFQYRHTLAHKTHLH